MANRREIDAGDAPFPEPLLLLIEAIEDVAPGDTMALYSKQPGTARNIPAWVAKAGHTLDSIESLEERLQFVVRKGH